MAESTATTYLGYASATGGVPTEFVKACDIIDYPDLSSPAERIEVTTLSNETRVYIKGLPDQADQVFTANFDRDQYKALKELGDLEHYWAVLFGDSGALFYFKGQSSIAVAGAGVGDVRTMSLTLYPNTEPTLDPLTWEYNSTDEVIKKKSS